MRVTKEESLQIVSLELQLRFNRSSKDLQEISKELNEHFKRVAFGAKALVVLLFYHITFAFFTG